MDLLFVDTCLPTESITVEYCMPCCARFSGLWWSSSMTIIGRNCLITSRFGLAGGLITE
jgi:hypothetical protein